jgi:hypothetical protein
VTAELAAHELSGDAGGEGVAGRDLAAQLVDRALETALVAAELGDRAAEVVEDDPVEGGGADDDAQRQRQEDRDDGDQVVPEVDYGDRLPGARSARGSLGAPSRSITRPA